MPSSLRVVRAALVSLYDVALGESILVFNGPRPKSATPRKYLLVGVNGIDELEAGIRTVQGASSLSGDWRDEAGEIDSTAVAWTGGDDMTQIRQDVDQIVDACESALRADRSLGGLLVGHHNVAEITRLDVREHRTKEGPFVEAVFTTSYSTVLTS